MPDGTLVPCDGELFYRGINVKDLIAGFVADNRFGFEETVYLLLIGELPNRANSMNSAVFSVTTDVSLRILSVMLL